MFRIVVFYGIAFAGLLVWLAIELVLDRKRQDRSRPKVPAPLERMPPRDDP